MKNIVTYLALALVALVLGLVLFQLMFTFLVISALWWGVKAGSIILILLVVGVFALIKGLINE